MVLLFGNNTLSNKNNKAIFKAVYKYIHQTKKLSAGNLDNLCVREVGALL